MRRLVAAVLTAGIALSVIPAAQAREGCGKYEHRGPHGRCLPNRGPAARPAPLIVGNFYQGRGYWDGHRYWKQRYQDKKGWHYR